MSEKRMIYADDIVKVADHAYDQWNLAMAAADGQREINLCFKRQDLCKAVAAVAKNAPTIDSETLPIVRELRAKLARYEKAEAEGRLVIVPEKLYDLVYDELAPDKSYITEYSTEGGSIAFAGDYVPVSEIGRTVFRTREEAEAALKEREGSYETG